MLEHQEIRNILTKYAAGPGLCTAYETERVNMYLLDLKDALADFNAAFNREPVGLTVDSMLDELKFYLEHNKDK